MFRLLAEACQQGSFEAVWWIGKWGIRKDQYPPEPKRGMREKEWERGIKESTHTHTLSAYIQHSSTHTRAWCWERAHTTLSDPLSSTQAHNNWGRSHMLHQTSSLLPHTHCESWSVFGTSYSTVYTYAHTLLVPDHYIAHWRLFSLTHILIHPRAHPRTLTNTNTHNHILFVDTKTHYNTSRLQ